MKATIFSVGELIKKNYKRAELQSVYVEEEYCLLRCFTAKRNYPFIAKRLLNKFPELKTIHFTGGFIEDVYTRNTLAWGGYNVK